MSYHFKFATRTPAPLIVMLLLNGPVWGANAVDVEAIDPDYSAISPLRREMLFPLLSIPPSRTTTTRTTTSLLTTAT